MNIEKRYTLGEKNFVEKQTFAPGALNYNSTVTLSGDYFVVADVGGKKRWISINTGNIVNEPETHKWFVSKRKDPRSISIYFVAKHSFSNVSRGSHSMNKNIYIPFLQYEINYLSWDYRYSVNNPVSLINQLPTGPSCYFQSKIDELINDTINIDIETILSRAIDNHGLEKVSSSKQVICEDIKESIKEKIAKLGISLEITNLGFKEDRTTKTIKEEIQISKEIKKNKGE